MKLEDLAARRFNYDCVGSTTDEAKTPTGYHRLQIRERVGDAAAFERLAEAVMRFDMHRAAGIRMQATTARAEIGTMTLGRLAVIPVPCKVVWVVNEADRIGFAYGTLDGHPEAGEEAFIVTRESVGTWFTLLAYSRPATWYARLGGPVTCIAQTQAAHHYARSLRKLA